MRLARKRYGRSTKGSGGHYKLEAVQEETGAGMIHQLKANELLRKSQIDYIEKDLPKEFSERVIISETPSSFNPRKRKGLKVKVSKSLRIPSSERASKSKREIRTGCPSPAYYVTWDGFDETCEPVGQICSLCGNDLSSSALEMEEEEDEFEYYEQFERANKLPEVAVLACGHAFHRECLDNITPEDQICDPVCFLCLSYIT